jgi:pimeloyl-ACP methyl ester carboxylesterase
VRALGFGKGKPIIQAAHDMGALPALIWTADDLGEVAGLLYIEAPVMVGDVLRRVIAYTPEAMKEWSMWWWILPFAPEIPERLIVGHERAVLTWFDDRHVVNKQALTAAAVDEYLRTFSGREGVLGALGIYRAAFQSIEQTEPLAQSKIQPPVVAISGVKGLGAQWEQWCVWSRLM